MNAKKAKAIRRVMYPGGRVETTYQQLQHPYTIQVAGGSSYRGVKVQVVAEGARRAYLIGKQIYRKFGVLPRKQDERPS
jgi:hypothetical protein